MKILIVSLFLPKLNATHAGSRGVADVIRELSVEHEVHLATRVEGMELEDVAEIRKYCREIHLFPYKRRDRNILTVLRLVFSYLKFSMGLNNLIARGGFDLVQAEWVESAILLKKTKKNVPMILIANDVITKIAERRYLESRGALKGLNYLRYLLTRGMELRTGRKFNCIFTRSVFDRDYLLKFDPGLNVSVLPPTAGFSFTGKKVGRDENVILFFGSFRNRGPNIRAVLHFYEKIFPLVKSRAADVKFIVAGYGPTKEILEISRRDSDVVVTGFVEDMESCYKKATVFVAPILEGGGISTKILDAMAAGTPVVSTSIGNEGIGATDNVHLLIADTPSAFADRVVSLLSDKDLWRRLSAGGQAFISERFSRDSMMGALNKTYSEVLNGKN